MTVGRRRCTLTAVVVGALAGTAAARPAGAKLEVEWGTRARDGDESFHLLAYLARG